MGGRYLKMYGGRYFGHFGLLPVDPVVWVGKLNTGVATQKNFSVIIYLQVGGVKFSAITGFKKLSIARLK